MSRGRRTGRLRPVLRGCGALLCAAAALSVPAVAGSAATQPPNAGQKIIVQLRAPAQAEFAGYYAAKSLGFYARVGLNVDFKRVRAGLTPEEIVAGGRAQIGLDWLPAVLASRDVGTKLVSIAQMFGRSGMAEIAWKSSGIASIADLKHKRVGVWCCGNQLELYAALEKAGIDAADGKSVQIVNQAFDLRAFLHHRIDAAAALTYNQLAQVLEAKNPADGRLYTLHDLNVFRLENVGTGMLEDGLFAEESWIAANRDAATRFVAASDRGWIYCRNHIVACVQIVLRYAPSLNEQRELWQLNEINKLIWPSTRGIGLMDPAAFKRTAGIALQYKLIKHPATGKAFDGPLARAALRFLTTHALGVDVYGGRWMPLEVRPNAK